MSVSERNVVTNGEPPCRWYDRCVKAVSSIALIGLVFLTGMVGAVGQVTPFPMVRDACTAIGALKKQRALMSTEWPVYLWNPTDRNDKGVVANDTSRATPGYTTFSCGHGGRVRLLDMQGNTVHEWNLSFHEVWPDAADVPGWIPDQFIYAHRVKVFPNGDLLACFQTTVNTPYGCGLVKVDKYSKKIWAYGGHAHHEFAIGGDGRVYALTQRLRRSEGDEQLFQTNGGSPLIEDLLTILSPDGVELQTFSILDALVASPYFRPLLCHTPSTGDVLHCNGIDVIDEQFASQHEGISAGDLLVSLRNLSLLIVVHPASESIVWATTGPWNHPHDADPLANGNIMIFNNFVAHGIECKSAVIEFDPRTRRTVWSYEGRAESPLRSDIRSCQQSLDNGNVLITASDQGRIIEITRDGKIVWEYVAPERGGQRDQLVPIVCGAERFRYDELPFLQHGTTAAAEAPSGANRRGTMAGAE